MKISDFQSLMLEIYGIRDRARGPERTMLWLVEEIGELAEAVREGSQYRSRNRSPIKIRIRMPCLQINPL